MMIIIGKRQCKSNIDSKNRKWIRDSGAEWMKKYATTQDHMALVVTHVGTKGNVIQKSIYIIVFKKSSFSKLRK